jgi:gp16 family phage-associated protein
MPTTDRGQRLSPLNHNPEALRAALRRSGMSQRELARAIGKSESLVSEILAGTRNANPGLLPRIATALGCKVSDLEADLEEGAA